MTVVAQAPARLRLSPRKAAARIATAAGDDAGPGDRAAAVLDELQELIPYDCAELSWWDPHAGCHRVLANVGYSDELIGLFHSDSWLTAADELALRASSRAMRMRDTPSKTLAAELIEDVLLPAGFREGLTIYLLSPDGRYAGTLNVSTTDPSHPTDEARAAVDSLSAMLANVVDLMRSVRALTDLIDPDAPAVAITADGVAGLNLDHPLARVLSETSPAVEMARRLLRTGRRPDSFLWHDQVESWLRVHVFPVRGCLPDPHEQAVITLHRAEVPHQLTLREAEVLALLAAGLSNRDIAQSLVLSPRTVGKHVEHILDKLGVGSRTAAASVAAAEGLLVGSVGSSADL